MSSLPNLVDTIKQISAQAVGEAKPCAIIFGTVTSVEPLEITVDQKKVLEYAKGDFILGTLVRDFWVDMTVDHLTELATCTISHLHPYKGRKPFLVHMKLEIGERVILIRFPGGQQFYVVDRDREGEEV